VVALGRGFLPAARDTALDVTIEFLGRPVDDLSKRRL
jgi:hypothetical protein